MRTIHKRQIIPILEREGQKQPPSLSKEAEKRWNRFRRIHGTDIISYLLDEQWWLCAYTELALDKFEHGFHIEHIEPKRNNPARTFDYHNIVISALKSESLELFSKQDRFGGHHKQSSYDSKLFISPLMADSGRYFEYRSNGKVEPSSTLIEDEREKALYTIALLNLNAPFLVNARRKWLIELEEEIDKLLDDIDALKLLAECELCDINGKLREFHSASKSCFGHIGEQVIKTACPECVDSFK